MATHTARWLLTRNITQLGALTVDDLADYAVEVGRLGISTTTATNRLAAATLLWAFAPHLPPGDRIPMPPWHAESMRDYLPRTDTANENGTSPIHPAVMSPLLIWAMRFVDDFADDILAAWEEHQTLNGRIRPHADPAASAAMRELVEQRAASYAVRAYGPHLPVAGESPLDSPSGGAWAGERGWSTSTSTTPHGSCIDSRRPA